MRRFLTPVTIAWLFVHVGLITSVTIVTTVAGATTAADLECTCTHGTNRGMCPMHHTQSDGARCRMEGTQTDLGLALVSMLGIAVPASASQRFHVDAAALPTLLDPPAPFSLSVPPEPPPPRG